MVPVVPNSSLRINLSLARFRGALCLYGFQGPRKVDSDAIVDKWSGLLEPGKTTLSPREGRLVERVAAPDQPQTVWPKDRLSPQTLAYLTNPELLAVVRPTERSSFGSNF